jgi:hypothetical protein
VTINESIEFEQTEEPAEHERISTPVMEVVVEEYASPSDELVRPKTVPDPEPIIEVKEPWVMEFSEKKPQADKRSKLIERLSNRRSDPKPPRPEKKSKTKEELAEIRKSLVKKKTVTIALPTDETLVISSTRPKTTPSTPSGKSMPPADLLDRLTKGIKSSITKKEMREINKRHLRNLETRKKTSAATDTSAKLEEL